MRLDTGLAGYGDAVNDALTHMLDHKVLRRIWDHDHTLWKSDPAEISNRLGWLHSPEAMQSEIKSIEAFVQKVRRDGLEHAVLLGMGGSSLAPEVFGKTFGVKPGFLALDVLDSTHPDAIGAQLQRINLEKTLFIVSTKSGSTVETLSFFKFFYNHVLDALGADQAGKHFVAITDPGSRLEELAQQYSFRKLFLNDPNIGGRYAALSFVGLVPAALLGVDISTLLARAERMTKAEEQSGIYLGAVLGELAKLGRDKLTLVLSPSIAAFGTWMEQLVAESTGKESKGILPVALEPLGPPEVYGRDRLFLYLKLAGDDTHDVAVNALRTADYPVIWHELSDLYDLGGEFFRMELATAVAGHLLKINPFDQPNVESAKTLARDMMSAFQVHGKLPELSPTFVDQGVEVFSDLNVDRLTDAIEQFLVQATNNYVALQAYCKPSETLWESLQQLRTRIRDRTKLATTLGYGPRFLHSTGQLHKGDAGNGLFIQITSSFDQDVDIPDEAGSQATSMTFGILISAQALGDRQALLDAGRKVIRFHIKGDVADGVNRLLEGLR